MVQQIRKMFTIETFVWKRDEGQGAGGRGGGASDRSGWQANLFLFSQRGRRQTGGKEREKEGGISRSHSPYPHAIFFWQILHHEE